MSYYLEKEIAEFEKLLAAEVEKMKLEHKLFMAEMRRRFVVGMIRLACLYLGLQLVVYLIFGENQWP